jgi:hypothetical protein
MVSIDAGISRGYADSTSPPIAEARYEMASGYHERVRWRSPSEIAFRLRQEVQNLAFLAHPPKLPQGATPRAPFPDPDSALKTLRSTPTADAIVALADQIVLHRFPLLGLEIDTGPKIRWRRDYINDKETGTDYFRKIPYLDASLAGDHKIIWELNRHQHLVLLAQAYRLTERREYLDEIGNQLDSWFEANPMQRGINWASALEVAFRSLSWMWVDHLVGSSLPGAGRARLIEGLYQHARHLEANLSVYFSPNTHLLGEAVALHALGMMFRADRWEQLGARIVGEEMLHQVRADGSHFEQSSYYHVYALDMLLFHAILARPPKEYLASLERMAVYLEALIGPSRVLPFIGDDDGGRLFHPYGPRERFAGATLAACNRFLDRPNAMCREQELHELALWWLSPGSCAAASDRKENSAKFTDAGIVVMSSGAVHCIVDAGPFGPFRGGHSHADTLSIVASANGENLLIDPGTFSYAGDSPWRDRFRGTAAHNTVRIGRLDQAEPAGPFGWRNPPQVEILNWQSDGSVDFLDAACRYRGFVHRRRVFFLKPEVLFILDDIEGQAIEAEQFWHLGRAVKECGAGCYQLGSAAILLVNGDAPELSEGGDFGWRSPAYGLKEPAPVIVSRRKGNGSVQFGAALIFSSRETALVVTRSDDEVEMTLAGSPNLTVVFPQVGMPHVRSS